MGFISLTHLQTALNKIKDIFDTKANKLDIPTDFVKSGSSAKAGLVPAPSTTEGTTKYLCEDGTWTVPPDTTYSEATATTSGLMSKADKKKLDNIDENANKYTLPTATSSVLGGVRLGYSTNGKNYQVRSSNAGLYVAVPWKDTTYSVFGKSGGHASTGLVPKPSTITGTTKYLCEDGTWTVPPDTTYSAATTSVAGLMSAEDKAKLDGIENNAEANVQPDWEIVDENSDAFIKNKPESLPANGGNADTLDGFHAKEITSNPNLLINPNFKINQRGSTTYTGKGYTVDRWFNSTDYTVSTITDNGIKIGTINPSGGTSNTTIGQIGTNLEPETALLLRGKTITFSINVTELTAVGAKMMIFERNESDEPTYTTVKIASTGINTCKTTIKNDTTKIDVRIYGVDTRTNSEVYTNYTTVQWAKLEVGSVPSLFTPPDPATELLKCQRYYQKISGLNNHFSSGFIVATYIAATIINLPTSLNKKPTVVLNGNIYLNTKGYVATKAISCNSDSIIDIVPNDNNNIFTTTYNIGSDKSAILGQACTAQFRDNTSYIEFDTEMDI